MTTAESEKEQFVTMIATVNALGNDIPLIFIFPRVFLKTYMLANGPTMCRSSK